MPSRRSVLAGAVSLLAAGAGCTGVLGGARPDPALRDVTLRNTDDEAHALAVRLSHDGEVILDETYELGPWPYGDDGGTESDGTSTAGIGTTTAGTATAISRTRTTASDSDAISADGADTTSADRAGTTTAGGADMTSAGGGDTTNAGGADTTPAGDGSDHRAAIIDVWDSPRGEFSARIRVDDRDPVELRLDDSFRPSVTYRYEIRIEEDGHISTWGAVLDATATAPARS